MDASYGENRPMAECLEALIADRGMSIRELARRAGATPSHLSRIIRGVDRKRPSGALAESVARALDLPADHFAETRIATILEAVGDEAGLRDRAYRLCRERPRNG